MRAILFAGLPVLYVLHQDWWFWNDPTLVGGVLPAGLAYQVVYTLVVCLWMTLLVLFAWRAPTESAVDEAPAGDSSSR